MNANDEFPYEAPLRNGIARIVEQALGWTDPATTLNEMIDRVVAMAEDLHARLASEQPPPNPLACRQGCDHCCHWYEVSATPLEALRIADHVNQTFDADARRELIDRVHSVTEEKKRFPPSGPRPSFRCPLLVDGACSVYHVRPFVCRAFNSYDVTSCVELIVSGNADDSGTSTIEGYAHTHKIMISALRGFRLGVAARGLSPDMHDLALALGIAFDEPDAARRWLAGEPLFRPARSRLAGHRDEWAESAEYGDDGNNADPSLT
jgi:uncharacterized protein